MIKQLPVDKRFVETFQDEDLERIVRYKGLMVPFHTVLEDICWYDNVVANVEFFTFESILQKVQRSIGNMIITIKNNELISVEDNRERNIVIEIDELNLSPRIHIVNYGFRKLTKNSYSYGWDAFYLEKDECKKILSNGSSQTLRKVLLNANTKNIVAYNAGELPEIQSAISREELRETLPKRSVTENRSARFHAVILQDSYQILLSEMGNGYCLV